LEPLSALYGTAASWRRRWYAHQPSRRRHLAHPVISVGNLRVGGSGKTPVVAHLARLLAARGERPSILSRGYARERDADGVTVVSDGTGILATLAESGDEPLLLARTVPAVPVLVCAERALAGRLAEEQFGVTIHLLDDGFQHVRLARDVDLLLVDPGDLEDRVLPAGRLREPVSSAAAADALVVAGVDARAAEALAGRLHVARGWAAAHSIGEPRLIRRDRRETPIGCDIPAFAAAGIARPERFFNDLRVAGWQVVGTRIFRDHHRFQQRDIDRIVQDARRSGAALVLTTEKDAVRLEPLDLAALPFASVALDVRIEPVDEFMQWLSERLAAARARASGNRR
jgi:tetraacyldisaccharide 4'-kinase